MRITLRLITFACLLFISGRSFSQETVSYVTRDLESWNSIGLQYKVNKKHSFKLNQGLRLVKNASNVDQVLTDLGYKYKIGSGLSMGATLRYSKNKGGNGEFDNDFRWNFDLGYQYKFDRLKIYSRLRYQNKNEIGLSVEEGDVSKKHFRIKLGGKYNIKNWKFDPDFSTELFRSYTLTEKGFDNIRFTLGTKTSLTKKSNLTVFYRLERELGVTRPQTTYILGLKYLITFKN